MAGTTANERVARVITWGLAKASNVYALEADGRRVFRGARPGDQWVGHGTFPRDLFTLHAGQLLRVTVHKQRWRLRGTTRTCHSWPPNDIASVWFCSLIAASTLWGWLSSEAGLHRHEPATAALSSTPSARTLQRWLRRALPHVDETAMALRRAVIGALPASVREHRAAGV